MLEIHNCSSPLDKGKILSTFDHIDQTWIVSDLQSKWHLQRKLLYKNKVLEEQAVMRASEFWRRLAVQLLPNTRLLSGELTQSLFWHWLQSRGEPLPWLRTPNSLQVLLQQMRQWISVFADPNYMELMQAWFIENPGAFEKWGQWFFVSREIWEKCKSENVIAPSWLPALLLQQDLSQLVLKKKLIFDLGVQLTPVEGQLISELAKHFPVEVIRPHAKWSGGFHQPVYGYQVLAGEGRRQEASLEWDHLKRSELSFVRYSTRVAEVKGTVAQVRKWLDSGVAASQIGIVAPDIEEHWPLLDLYLRQEGILAQKGQVARLHSFPEMTKWMAHLRVACRQISTSDLAATLFLNEDDLAIPFSEFRILYTSIYGPEDLGRSSLLKERWQKNEFGSEPITQEDFFVLAARFWRGSQKAQSHLEKFAQFVTQDCPRHLKLKPSEWLSYWQGVLSRLEVPIREDLGEKLGEGIWCVSLSSTDWLDLSHGIFLNMSASSMRQLSQSPVTFSDLEKLSKDLGYPLDSPDQQQMEFEFLWLAEKKWQQLIGSFAQTDVEGSVLTPSRIWLWGAHLHGEIPKESSSPAPTRWDEIQRSSIGQIADIRKWPEARALALERAVARDEGKAILPWPQLSQLQLSASSLEDYFQCPFIFTAKKIFRLSDNPVLDLDLDRMSRGRLMHAVFARVMMEPVRFNWTDAELVAAIEDCARNEGILIGEPGLWQATVNAHVQLTRTLLAMEKQWRSRFPRTKTMATELNFKAYWQKQSAKFSSEPSSVQVSGRIDRVDGDGQNYLVMDYKSSSNGLSHWGSWLNNDTIQLSLYAQMVEEGFTDLPKGTVESAHYFVAKKQERHRGYFLKSGQGNLFDVSSSVSSSVNEDRLNRFNLLEPKDLEAHRNEMNVKISQAIQCILDGQLGPSPKDINSCKTCSWSSLCRSPHLN